LHDGADTVGAAEDQMLALRLRHERCHASAVTRHFGRAKPRIFGFDEGGKMRRERNHWNTYVPLFNGVMPAKAGIQ
jgi:hypothetical protein